MVYRVVGPNDRRTKVEIELSIDAEGEYAFDPDGKAVKGRDPVVLVLPRFNYMPFQELKDFMKMVADIEDRETSTDYDSLDKARDLVLAQLQPFVSDDEYKLVENLSWGELQNISARWAEESNTPLGESSASNGSSKNIRRPSNTTSSDAVSASAT